MSCAISPNVRCLPGARRVLELEVVAEVALVDDELADGQVVERHPDRAAPVRVAAEHARDRLGGLVVDPRALDAGKGVRVVLVPLRHRAQPVRREEGRLVEELLERAAKLVGVDHRQEHAAPVRGLPHPPDHAPARLLPALAQAREALAELLGERDRLGRQAHAGSTGIRPEIVCTFTWVDSPDGYTSRS